MSINFYYDIITDDGPVPNGIINYKFNFEVIILPVVLKL